MGKAGGVGDVELLGDSAPIEIGNRAWCDFGSGIRANDSNGIQDPAEANISGLTIRMTCGSDFAETITNATGNYLFTDTNWNASANTTSSTIPYNTSCTVSIDTVLPANITAQMNSCGLLVKPTIANSTSAFADDDIRDSDGVLSGVMLSAVINTSGSNTTGGTGENDHSIDFGFMIGKDWGDAPDSYGTSSATTGPNHTLDAQLYMGVCVDDETDGQANIAADGDDNAALDTITNGVCATVNDDEDSLTPPVLIDSQANPTLDVIVVNTTGADATVACWIDYDGDGVFDDATERGSAITGVSATVTITMPNVPATANSDSGGSSYLRCRIASDAAEVASATGAASNGEVEDYPIVLDPSYVLGDYVWYDSNQDGIQDTTELGVNGINVNLYTTLDCSGVVSDSTTTLANGGFDGFYQFFPLPAGDYCIEFTGLPVGSIISPNTTGTPASGSDADQVTGQIQNIVLNADDADEDMGIFVPGTISGLVWCESGLNENLTYDPVDNDTLQNNITVNLYADANCNDTLDASETGSIVSQSTVAGHYLFSNLFTSGPGAGPVAPGCYIVEVDTSDPDLGHCFHSITPTLLTPDIDAITPDSTDNDFGHEEHLLLGNYIWYDNNQDGLQDITEIGVNGVTATLFYDATCTAGTQVEVPINTSNGGLPATDGHYLFTELPSGLYCIEFTNIPVGWVATLQEQGADDAVNSDSDPTTFRIENINLIDDDLEEDTGIYAAIGEIPGTVFCDSLNFDGVLGVNEGLPDIGVSLSRDSDCDGVGDIVYATVDTDANGEFVFASLPVANTPIPPNLRVCYTLDYDVNDLDLAGCTLPFLPLENVVELTVDDPVADPTVFGHHFPPLLIPVNNVWWLALLMLFIMVYAVRNKRRSS